ncbi:acylphosphatase [Anaerococcus sp. AGMB09787]|uniref:acylphosphatase n=1 Tax=Anaerococcus sp. AGMB09787 TaxID=2922869 RepID=UPI001FAF3533|nr:acylphosphatase [Anaerococcus sp. AGMB09787]
MKRYKIIFKGRVQGVGFRYKALMIAKSLGLLGSVKNLYDGNVEVILQGSKDLVVQFINLIENESFIRVESKVINELGIDESLDKFEILY